MATSDSTPAPFPDLSDLPTRIVRLVCQLTGLVLIAVGVIYLLDVFAFVREVFSNPTALEERTAKFAKLIDADKMIFRQAPPQNVPANPAAPAEAPPAPAAEEGFPVGKSVALGMAFCWHLLFFWIPWAILAAGGKLIYWTLADSRHTREAVAELLRRPGAAPPRDRPRTLDLSGK